MSTSRPKLPHDSAATHVTGRSEYIDDRPRLAGELDVEVFFSPHAHAEILSIDLKDALAVPGVRAIYTARDFHSNIWGTIFQDQPLLASDRVQFVGEAIAVVAGDSLAAVREAKSRIRVRYKVLPAILSIDAARAANSFIGFERAIARGDAEQALAAAPHRLTGAITLRGADHFYLESQACVAYPREDGQLEVHSSAQHPTEVQHVVAHALGLEYKDVVCIVKRMGGGFGGKESQAAPFAAYAALVAQKLQRPARLCLTKDDDMIMTGKRNPFQNSYTVGFDGEGRILALDAKLFSDGGAYADLSTSIMERAMLHSDNAYFIPNFRVTGRVCRTHMHPHTAFRGFGGPKGAAMIEGAIEEIAHHLGRDPLEVRKLNSYQPGGGRDVTPYGQKIENLVLPKLFSQLESKCEYGRRRKEIDAHNQKALQSDPDLPLRGLSLTAVKFGISFTTRFLNQANALVLVHRDGTLQVSTGATEMGQGVNARIAELVASELGLHRDAVRMMTTSTEKNANTSPTAASSGTDLNGAAALLACRRIKYRLSQVARALLKLEPARWARTTAGLGTEPELAVEDAPLNPDPNAGADWPSGVANYFGIVFQEGFAFAESHPQERIPFADVVSEAYLNRVSLSEYAHYRIPNLSFDKLKGTGQAFMYFTQGTACSEVEIDRTTGEIKVRRVDLLMDLGRPIHRELDLGQVSGAFVQGMGWMTTEKLHYNEGGALLSHAPSTYKIPSAQDTPRIFNIDLLPNDENRVNVRGTKAVGEPPLLLAISVWTAARDALKHLSHARSAALPRLEIPATQEQLLRAVWPDQFKVWDRAK